MRKRTRFALCSVHLPMARDGRQRLAEMFCEGGPGTGKPCDWLGPCRVYPGSDLFAAGVTDGMADEWVNGWTVNQVVTGE
jgi:hypothetical protein